VRVDGAATVHGCIIGAARKGARGESEHAKNNPKRHGRDSRQPIPFRQEIVPAESSSAMSHHQSLSYPGPMWRALALLLVCGCQPPRPPVEPAQDLDVDPPPTTSILQFNPSPVPGKPRSAQPAQPSTRRPPDSSRTLVDVDFHRADAGNVLRFLAEIGEVNVVLPGRLNRLIDLRMRQAPWQQVFEAALHAARLTATLRDGVWTVVAGRP
jgi:hypothetical protein